MKVTPLSLPEVLLIDVEEHADERGGLFESWEKHRYSRQVTATDFVQDNVTTSKPGVVRGLHFQHPDGQGKLITVLDGSAFDVVLDVRRGSPTFGKWASVTLTAGPRQQLWVPPGFAHGFQALGEGVTLMYKATARWRPDTERAVLYSDPVLDIPWPLPVSAVSERDRKAARLVGIPPAFLPILE